MTLRRFAAATQVLLQIGILLTGNYNFFNILTVIMALSVLDVNTNEPQRAVGSTSLVWIARADSAWQQFQTSYRVAGFMGMATALYCACSATEIFEVVISKRPRSPESLLAATSIRFLPTVEDVQAWIARVLPVSVIFAACVFAFASTWQMLRAANMLLLRSDERHASTASCLVKMVYLLACTLANVWIFSSSVLTLSILDRAYQSSMPSLVIAAYEGTAKYRITSPYGLFRTMTGVGTMERDGERVSVVARPEIILEGTADDGKTWREYHFKHKPGDVYTRPSRAMPMQPRLDWQMWFAALGDYNGAPWLVHLVNKLLEGSGDVKALLDTNRDPFPDEPPQAIRARLYYYDFTRSSSVWSRGDANSVFDASGDEKTGVSPAAVDIETEDSKDLQRQQWWSRVFVREYLPALERGNPSLRRFVEHHYGVGVDTTSNDAAFQCSHKLPVQGRRASASCHMLQALVQSEYSPFGLAAIVLIAKFASSQTLLTAAKLWTRSQVASSKQKRE